MLLSSAMGVPFMDASCFVEDFGVSIERCYYGSRHGKNRCDGEAGVVKSKATRLVKNDEAIITNAREFFDAVSEHLTKGNNDENCCLKRRVFIFVESAEIVRPRIDRSAKVVKGTRQLHSILGATTKGNIQTRKLSCFCTQCIDRRYDRCVNGSHVDGWQSVMIKSVHLPVNRPEEDSDDTAVDEDEDNGHNGDPVVLDEDPVVLDDGHGHDEDPVVLDDGHGVPLELGNISFDPDTSFSYIKDYSMIEDTACTVGDHVLVKHGSEHLPAVIANIEDEFLWIQYYHSKHRDNWTLQTNEYTIQKTDFNRKLEPPDLVFSESRYSFKFDI